MITRLCAGIGLFALQQALWAATLQISPVIINMQSGENASGLTLRNPGDIPLYGQVRVFLWDQTDDSDTLTATGQLVASPPLIQIAAGGSQLVRLVRTTPAPAAAEQTYRVLIDELPQPDSLLASGVMIRLRYSVPIFVEPAGAGGAPRLAWHLIHRASAWFVSVDNSGTRHAQISAIQLINGAGKVYPINGGLLGYALAGRSHRWEVALPADASLDGSVKIRASVNTQLDEINVAVETQQ